MDRTPCRVSADLAAYDRQQREDAMDATRFDEYQDDHVLAILGNERLAKPIQELLTTLHQFEITRASFGADKTKVCDALIPDLLALRDACRDAWGDL